MKLSFTLPLLLALPVPALADVPGKDWISQQRVADILAKRDAKIVTIEADDGHWEGEATQKGVRYEFHVDPRSGAVTKWERDVD